MDLTQVHVAYCPERVLPGKIMVELLENDRVVGGLTPEATGAVADFYRSFVRGDVLETDAATAEMCKLTENSYRDVNIAFANELSLLCDKAGINVWKLIELANHHLRVNILQPQGYDVVAVEPNIESHSSLKLVVLDEALASADVVTILVKHRQFAAQAKLGSFGAAKLLDFCGVQR